MSEIIRRYDRIMQMLEEGVPYNAIAQMYHTTIGTIKAYDKVRAGKLTSQSGRGPADNPRQRVWLSDAEVKKICNLREKGASLRDIGDIVHRDRRAITAILKQAGVESPKEAQRRVQEEYKDRILQLHRDGAGGPQKIAELLGLTEAIVGNVLLTYVYKFNGGGKRRGAKKNDSDGTRGVDANQSGGDACEVGGQQH